MTNRIEKISFAFPVHNEEDNIDELYKQVKDACQAAKVDYEMIFVDDGSTDKSLAAIKDLREKDKKVRFVSLSRSFGHQNAIFAGMSKATGDAVITMDADLQHPPSIIPEMIKLWRSGIEVVYTKKAKTSLPPMKYLIIRSSYWFISKISGLNLDFGQSDFRLLDSKVLKVILEMPEYHKFLRGQVSWVGFNQKGISYDVQKRHGGVAKYSYKHLYDLALNGIFSFGKYPLHIIMVLGVIVCGISALFLSSVLIIWILKIANICHIPMPPGWSSLIIALMLLGSVQLITIGVVGEFVGRIYDQTKLRPVFIVREESERS